ncbi:MAG: tetratricopeptide repeat protein [Deltaproteobacteria bacterium]|nr:MAG: tetratricopeptide repeat protein [Deltaproteobacteria bacterium]
MKSGPDLSSPRAEWGIVLSMLLLVTALLYGHTLHVPFYLDDDSGIVQSYPLRDLAEALKGVIGQRGLARFSFALNYRIAGWSLPELHLTSIAVHAICGLVVWRLLRRILPGRWLPVLGALLFLAHPLQTQAVTYLSQRATLMGTGFFLLAFLCHLRARAVLASGIPRRAAAYLRPCGGAVLSGAAALLCKENTAVLPLVLFAWNRLFPLPGRRDWRQELGDCLPFCVVPALMAAGIFVGLTAGGEPRPLYYPLASLQHNSPLHYLVTQFSVLWIYLRLLVLPYGQALEHDYPVAAQMLTLQGAVALAGLVAVAWLAWTFRRQRPLLAFGFAWFFLGLAVESSVIPLDPLFEHRLYLPMFGFLLVLLDGVPALLGTRRGLALLLAFLVVCLPLTWRRNALWNDPIAFYEDNLRQVPDSERAMMELAFRYDDAGRTEAMRSLLERAVQLYPDNYEFQTTLADLYADRLGLQAALAVLDRAIARIPDNVELYETAALIAERHGRRDLIYAYLNRGLERVNYGKWRLLNDLGVYYTQDGAWQQAEQVYRQSLALYADNPVACQYLAALLFAQQRWREAFDLLQTAQRLEPGNPKTLEGLARTARALGDESAARWAEERLRLAAVAEQREQGGLRP